MERKLPMLPMNLTNNLDELKRIYPGTLLPGDAEPEWLRRKAEYARELPLLMAERAKQPATEERIGLLGRLRVAIGL